MFSYLQDNLPEVLAVAAAFIGWCSATVGIWLLTMHPAVWFLSAGLLLLGLFGWRLLFAFLMDGVYGTFVEQSASEEEDETSGARSLPR